MNAAGAISDLVTISRFAGADRLLVQGGGGNTSVKSTDGERMWIKASGIHLTEVGETAGYAEVAVAPLVALVRDEELAAQEPRAAHEESVRRVRAAAAAGGAFRPSLEAGFHALLDRLVLHTHPVYVNAFSCLEEGPGLLTESLGREVPWVPYAAPGYALSREVGRVAGGQLEEYGNLPGTLVLQNHGLISAGRTPEQVTSDTADLVAAGRRVFGPLPAGVDQPASVPRRLASWAEGLAAALVGVGQPLAVRPARLGGLTAAARAPHDVPWQGALVPDDVVYGVHEVVWASPSTAPRKWLAESYSTPPGQLIVAVEGLGVVLAARAAKLLDMIEEALLAHALIRRLAVRHGRIRQLPDSEIRFLSDMESERHRRAVAAGQADSAHVPPGDD